MKSIIIYGSCYGTTEKYAQEMSQMTGTECVPYEKVNINEREMDLSGVLDRKYRIKNAMTFIEEIVKENSVDNMKYFLFDRIKCVTLYNFYINSNI